MIRRLLILALALSLPANCAPQPACAQIQSQTAAVAPAAQVATPIAAVTAQYVQDPGFSVPVVPLRSFVTDPPASSGTPWTFGGMAGITAAGTSYGAALPPGVKQVVFLEEQGSVSQTVHGWGGAQFWQLTASMAQRPFSSRGAAQTYNRTPQHVTLSIDGVAIETYTPSGTAFVDHSFLPFYLNTPGDHTLALQGTQTMDDTAFATNLRLVQVYPIMVPALTIYSTTPPPVPAVTPAPVATPQ